MLPIEPEMVIMFWACISISYKHMSFWYPVLEPHQTTFHSNIVVQLGSVTEIGLSTLLNLCRVVYEWFSCPVSPSPLRTVNFHVWRFVVSCLVVMAKSIYWRLTIPQFLHFEAGFVLTHEFFFLLHVDCSSLLGTNIQMGNLHSQHCWFLKATWKDLISSAIWYET